MSMIDEAKAKVAEMNSKIKEGANDLENKAHEKKGELKGRLDQAKKDRENEK